MPLGTIVSNAVNFRAWDINGNQTLWSPLHMLLDEAANPIGKSNALPVGGGTPVVTTATIGSGSALSSAVDLGRTTLAGIVMPAAWTATNLTFDVSADNAVFVSLRASGAEVALTVAANEGHSLDSSIMMSWRYVKLRSGPLGSPVNQTQTRVITLIGVQ